MLTACLVAGVFIGAAIVSLLAVLVFRPQKSADSDLSAKVHALELDLENVYDQILSWRKREGSREKREVVPPESPVPGNGTRPATREELKARLLTMKRGSVNG